MHQTSLSTEDLDVILPLLDSVCARYTSVADPRLVGAAPRYARRLPGEVREFLAEFRDERPSAVCVLSDFPVDDAAIGPTPGPGGSGGGTSPALRQEVFLLLCASVLGDVFTPADEPDGRVVQDVVGGGDTPAWWRTEDAAGPVTADYVGLMCLRNPDDIATTICQTDWIDWSGVDTAPLFEYPAPVPVLSGDRGRPYLSVDPARVEREQMAPATRAAYDALTRAIDVALNGFVLWPGDIAFIDNRRAVHGQEPFDARYDGTDRWLKRLKISRNLHGHHSGSGSLA